MTNAIEGDDALIEASNAGEQAARIVEAFEAGASDATAELLTEIAQELRDASLLDWEQAARIVDAREAGADQGTAELLSEVAREIRDRAIDD